MRNKPERVNRILVSVVFPGSAERYCLQAPNAQEGAVQQLQSLLSAPSPFYSPTYTGSSEIHLEKFQ
jgi:hypothetical protein